MFFDAFGTDQVSEDLAAKAIAQFIHAMISADSKFDKFRRGETQLSDVEYLGYQLFQREGETLNKWLVENSDRLLPLSR